MAAHAAAAAPEEACGILAGRRRPAAADVLRAIPCRNAHEGDRRRRFLIDPEHHLAAQREVREAGLEILGFYHSHPEGGAAPSEEDRRQAHPWVSNLILACRGGAPAGARSWRLAGDGGWIEEPVSVAGVTGAGLPASEPADGC